MPSAPRRMEAAPVATAETVAASAPATVSSASSAPRICGGEPSAAAEPSLVAMQTSLEEAQAAC